MRYVNTTFLGHHWDDLITMIEENYAQCELPNTLCVLGAYAHRTVAELRVQYNALTDKLIIYQTEPLVSNHWWKTEKIVEQIRGADEVWDYDLQNIEVLRTYGIEAKFRPPAYTNALKRVNNVAEPDIDVLFYGSYTKYRQEFINDYMNGVPIYNDSRDNVYMTANFMWAFNLAGPKLDNYIARSKIILNLNPYDGDTRQQQTRIFYPLINNKCVVSQYSPINYFGDTIHQFNTFTDLKVVLTDIIENDKWKNLNFDNSRYLGNKNNTEKIAIFYHIAQIGDWRRIFEEQIIALQQSGLYAAADYIHFGINGDESMPYVFGKVNRIVRNPNKDLEADTLNDMWKFCKANPDYKVMYIHTKGVTHNQSQNIELWRKYLEYFVVGQWKRSVSYLSFNDCVGTEWEDTAHIGDTKAIIPHYAGNFWWANASYISRLDPSFLYVKNEWPRWQGEFWIGTGSPRYYNFYSSGKNKYAQAVLSEEYANR